MLDNRPCARRLLAQGANPNASSYHSETSSVAETPLSIAAGKGDLELVRKLLDAGGDVHQYEDYESSPAPALFWAVRGGSHETIGRLLEAGADVNIITKWQDGNRVTSVGLSCRFQEASVVGFSSKQARASIGTVDSKRRSHPSTPQPLTMIQKQSAFWPNMGQMSTNSSGMDGRRYAAQSGPFLARARTVSMPFYLSFTPTIHCPS